MTRPLLGEVPLPLSPPYQLIHDALKSGQIIPFLGAGASLGPRLPPGAAWSATASPPTYLPSGAELTEHLATQAAFPAAEPRDLAKVAQYFHVQAGRASLHKTLHGIFSHPYAPLPIHTLLATTTKPLLVVTTNYDTLLEQAFTAAGKPFDLVVHTVASLGERIYHRAHGSGTVAKVLPQKLDVDLTKMSVLYKVHGSSDPADPKRDEYVITEDDYIDFLTRLVRKSAIPAFCAEPFQAWPFLFVGYRLGDWNMRVVLNRISSQGRLAAGVVSWAIDRQPSEMEERFWQARGVNVYTKEVSDFVTELSALGPL